MPIVGASFAFSRVARALRCRGRRVPDSTHRSFALPRTGAAMRRSPLLAVPLLLMTVTTIAAAQAAAPAAPPRLADVANTVSANTVAINFVWTLVAGFLVMFMQAGFAMVETGFTRAKNAAHTITMNFMVYGIAMLAYWAVGFALQAGGVGALGTLGGYDGMSHEVVLHIAGKDFGLVGHTGFFLTGVAYTAPVFAYFLFQMVFMDTAATIPTGSMAERLKFIGFCIMGLWVSMVVYPIAGNWIWGGGWLQNMGRIAGFGNGAVDFAGSGVVHMIGGSVALAGAIVLGPRIGRFNPDGSPNALPGHNIPLGILGTIILFFGWFGFNPGSSLAFVGGGGMLAANAAVNTLVAGATGGSAAMLYMWLFGPTKKPDPGMSVNGILAGLVAITAPCAFVSSASAAVIGTVAGVLVCLGSFALERLRIDDPVGAVPVHFLNGVWGVLAVGLFANGNPASAGWNGMDGTVRGLFHGNPGQLASQALEVGAILVFVFGLSFLFFKLLNAMKLLRVSPKDELAGLDIPEMGAPGYTAVDMRMRGGRLVGQYPLVNGRKSS
jgi:Amt family ammonium transporter